MAEPPDTKDASGDERVVIRRVVVENFMAHKHTVLDLSPGLTVIIGPNNCGKSALVAALQAVVQNPRATYMIRHGCAEARVTIETSDDHVITWHRRQRGASYVIDGVRTDRGVVPDNRDELLRLSSVASTEQRGKSFDVHFGDQKQPIFLLDAPPSDAARFFAAASDAGLLIEMQCLHRRRTRQRKHDLTRLEADLVRLEHHLEKLAPVPDLVSRISELEASHAHLSSRLQHAESLRQDLPALQQTYRQHRAASSTHDALHPLTPPPIMSDLASLARWLTEATPLTARSRVYARQCEALTTLEEPPAMTDVGTLRQLLKPWRGYAQTLSLQRASLAALADLSRPPEIADTKHLRRTVDTLQAGLGRAVRCRHRHAALAPLVSPPKLGDANTLQRRVKDLDTRQRRHRHLTGTTQALVSLQDPPTLEDAAMLSASLASLRARDQQTRRALALHAPLTALSAPPSLHDTISLRQTTTALADTIPSACRAHALDEVLQTLAAPPEIEDIDALNALTQQLSDAHATTTHHRDRCRLFATLEPASSCHDTENLSNIWTLLAEAQATALAWRAVERAHARLRPPQDGRAEKGVLMATFDALEEVSREHMRQTREVSVLEALMPWDEGLDPRLDLEDLMGSLKDALDADRVCADALLAATHALEQARADLAAHVSAHPVCPTCGAALSVDHMLGGRHDEP